MAQAKRSRSTDSEEDHSNKKKPRSMTQSQISRKREMDREAQRNSRARTKSHIEYLESLVESLRASADDRVAGLLRQLDEKQTEIQRLKSVLNSIGRQVELAKQEVPAEKAPAVDSDSEQTQCQLPSPTSCSPQLYATPIAVEDPVREESLEELPIPAIEETVVRQICPDIEISTTSPLAVPPSSTECQSIAQMASSIANNSLLEGRFWYLAGALLNHLLYVATDAPITTAFDEEIPIRAVFHGWSSVIERYSLDRGWQWLKELDERVYFHLPPPTRLMHLRTCRLMFLKQVCPEDGWGALIPPFFAPRPLQEHVQHDPLVSYFPWPGFRERVLLSPLRYATNLFMESLRKSVDFAWNLDVHDLYVKDGHTGLYCFSEATNDRLMDMRSYRMGQDFFLHFPELRVDIPCGSTIPQSLLLDVSRESAVDATALNGSTNQPSRESVRCSDTPYDILFEQIRSPSPNAFSRVIEVLV